MEISSRKQDDAFVIKIKGRIESDSIAKLRKIASKIKKENPRSLILNFVDVDYVDTASVFALINELDWMKKYEGHICVVNPALQVEKVFELSQLRAVFENVIPVKRTEEK